MISIFLFLTEFIPGFYSLKLGSISLRIFPQKHCVLYISAYVYKNFNFSIRIGQWRQTSLQKNRIKFLIEKLYLPVKTLKIHF